MSDQDTTTRPYREPAQSILEPRTFDTVGEGLIEGAGCTMTRSVEALRLGSGYVVRVSEYFQHYGQCQPSTYGLGRRRDSLSNTTYTVYVQAASLDELREAFFVERVPDPCS